MLAVAQAKILVIESYHQSFAWDQSYIQGIEEVLSEHYQLSYFEMDTKRLPPAEHTNRAELAWQHYLATQPDLVILGDDNALKYLGPRFAQTTVPVVYLGVNNNPRHYQVHQRFNITGVLERPLIKRSITIIQQINDMQLKRILLMSDNSTTSQYIFRDVFDQRTQQLISGVEVELRLINDWRTWQQTVLNAKAEGFDAIAFILYQSLTDEDQRNVDSEQVISWSVNHTPLAPYGFWDFAVGKNKTIGGLVMVGYEQGKIAGEMALTILSTGAVPHTLGPKTAEKGRYLFSRSQLQHYKINLPEHIRAKAEFVE
ncbi:ABC transporter substrate-binding protein [Agarivorans sp.]|uniref:ABC transporter substrate-binding protein n=1 Tax=Agarivorans sp. TaxID=1872412 RepID=UPI003D048AA1